MKDKYEAMTDQEIAAATIDRAIQLELESSRALAKINLESWRRTCIKFLTEPAPRAGSSAFKDAVVAAKMLGGLP